MMGKMTWNNWTLSIIFRLTKLFSGSTLLKPFINLLNKTIPSRPLFCSFFQLSWKTYLVACLYQAAITWSIGYCLLICFHSTEPDITKVGVVWKQLTTQFCYPHYYLHVSNIPSGLLLKLIWLHWILPIIYI